MGLMLMCRGIGGVVDDVADAEESVCVGQRCSTPAMLLPTCCIDIRAGGTIPGALGGHFGH